MAPGFYSNDGGGGGNGGHHTTFSNWSYDWDRPIEFYERERDRYILMQALAHKEQRLRDLQEWQYRERMQMSPQAFTIDSRAVVGIDYGIEMAPPPPSMTIKANGDCVIQGALIKSDSPSRRAENIRKLFWHRFQMTGKLPFNANLI